MGILLHIQARKHVQRYGVLTSSSPNLCTLVPLPSASTRIIHQARIVSTSICTTRAVIALPSSLAISSSWCLWAARVPPHHISQPFFHFLFGWTVVNKTWAFWRSGRIYSCITCMTWVQCASKSEYQNALCRRLLVVLQLPPATQLYQRAASDLWLPFGPLGSGMVKKFSSHYHSLALIYSSYYLQYSQIWNELFSFISFAWIFVWYPPRFHCHHHPWHSFTLLGVLRVGNNGGEEEDRGETGNIFSAILYGFSGLI